MPEASAVVEFAARLWLHINQHKDGDAVVWRSKFEEAEDRHKTFHSN